MGASTHPTELIEFYEDTHVELYNLKDDVGESNNLAAAMPDTALMLRKKLHQWRTEVGAQMPAPNPGYQSRKRTSAPER